MTVPSSTSRNDYVGDGATTVFPYTFKVFAAGDLVVTSTDPDGIPTTLVLGVDYTVSGAGLPGGGNVTLTTPLPGTGDPEDSHALAIVRSMTATQDLDLRNQGPYLAETVERALDRSVMLIQQQQEELNRSLKVPPTVNGVTVQLPSPVAGALIGWNPTGTGLENQPFQGAASYVQGITVDTFDAGTDYTAGTTTALALSGAPYSVNACLVSFDGVLQHKGSYTVIGTALTFDAPIPIGVDQVEVTWGYAIADVLGEAAAATVAASDAAGAATAAAGTATAATADAVAATTDANDAASAANAAAATANASAPTYASAATGATLVLTPTAREQVIARTAQDTNLTVTTSGLVAGRHVSIHIKASGGDRTITWPASWNWLTGAPTLCASGKWLVVSLTVHGTSDADVVASGVAQP